MLEVVFQEQMIGKCKVGICEHICDILKVIWTYICNLPIISVELENLCGHCSILF